MRPRGLLVGGGQLVLVEPDGGRLIGAALRVGGPLRPRARGCCARLVRARALGGGVPVVGHEVLVEPVVGSQGGGAVVPVPSAGVVAEALERVGALHVVSGGVASGDGEPHRLELELCEGEAVHVVLGVGDRPGDEVGVGDGVSPCRVLGGPVDRCGGECQGGEEYEAQQFRVGGAVSVGRVVWCGHLVSGVGIMFSLGPSGPAGSWPGCSGAPASSSLSLLGPGWGGRGAVAVGFGA